MNIPNINIKKELEKQFLYENDLDSVYLLFCMMELERSSDFFKPKYKARNSVKRSIQNVLAYREDNEMIASAILQLINDEINRLELSLFLEAYEIGYESKRSADLVEESYLKNAPVEDLCGRKKLYHEAKGPIIKELKKNTVKEILEEEDYLEGNRKFIIKFAEKFFLDKILSVNKYLNKQMVLHIRKDSYSISEEYLLTKEECIKIYKRICKNLVRSLNSSVRDACWNGVNDRVLSRYWKFIIRVGTPTLFVVKTENYLL